LVSNVVAPHLVALEDVHWARDGAKFAFKVHGCNVTYIAKYNLVQHLQMQHNAIIEPSKLKCPSTREEGPKHQDHATMNAWVLNNLLARFCNNEQNVIVRAKRHINLEWDRLQVVLWNTPKVPKLALVCLMKLLKKWFLFNFQTKKPFFIQKD
jgi:hypothetical protein